MCDYSLHNVASRRCAGCYRADRGTLAPVPVGAASEDARVAVCVLPGTNWRLQTRSSAEQRALLGWGRGKRIDDERRSSGRSTKSAWRRITMRWNSGRAVRLLTALAEVERRLRFSCAARRPLPRRKQQSQKSATYAG